jgi:hypothetical protein
MPLSSSAAAMKEGHSGRSGETVRYPHTRGNSFSDRLEFDVKQVCFVVGPPMQRMSGGRALLEFFNGRF